ncbi:MAG TPA: GNAT family acetyltransferase [Chthoniobacteraceae bacterium]|nr:GNAT family acetyltransferase [Chthoniobacteraceae bacterium]
MQIRPFRAGDENAIVALWRRCDLIRPWNDPSMDIRRKRAVTPELFLAGVIEGEIVASIMAGYEGHRGWLNYLAVAPERQRRGYGRAMVAEAERLLKDAGCPKINLLVRATNRAAVDFYRKLGYTVDEVACMGKRLEHDDASPAV